MPITPSEPILALVPLTPDELVALALSVLDQAEALARDLSRGNHPGPDAIEAVCRSAERLDAATNAVIAAGLDGSATSAGPQALALTRVSTTIGAVGRMLRVVVIVVDDDRRTDAV